MAPCDSKYFKLVFSFIHIFRGRQEGVCSVLISPLFNFKKEGNALLKSGNAILKAKRTPKAEFDSPSNLALFLVHLV